MTALTILLIVQILLMAVIICLLLRHDYDDCKNCNSHDKLTTYYHEKKPKPTKDDC